MLSHAVSQQYASTLQTFTAQPAGSQPAVTLAPAVQSECPHDPAEFAQAELPPIVATSLTRWESHAVEQQ